MGRGDAGGQGAIGHVDEFDAAGGACASHEEADGGVGRDRSPWFAVRHDLSTEGDDLDGVSYLCSNLDV
jgi:hypothetical protein